MVRNESNFKADEVLQLYVALQDATLDIPISELKDFKRITLDANGSKMITFKLNVDQHFKKRDELVEEFKIYLGEEALIRVEFVNEIPLLSSGKRRKVVQEFYK